MTSFHNTTTRPVLFIILLTSLVSGACSSIKSQSFLHQGHRGNYALSVEDLQKMQFYVSREVLAQRITAEGQTTAEDVIVLPFKTPGKALDAGPDWIRVSFIAGGGGTLFLASAKDQDSMYKLATEIEGGGIQRLETLPDKVLVHHGNRYKVIHGESAFLLVDQKDLDKKIGERTHLPGAAK